jgi:hypothetical protein
VSHYHPLQFNRCVRSPDINRTRASLIHQEDGDVGLDGFLEALVGCSGVDCSGSAFEAKDLVNNKMDFGR